MRKNPTTFDAIKSLKLKRPSTAKKVNLHQSSHNSNFNNANKAKPDWDSTVNDLNTYKLSRAEQVCKCIYFMKFFSLREKPVLYQKTGLWQEING